MNFLTATDIALKYNRSPEAVKYFAKKNNVPFEKVKKGLKTVTVYKFFPQYENLFANRKASRHLPSTPPKIFILTLSNKNLSPLVFKTFETACFYLKNNLAIAPLYFKPYSRHFKTFINSISASFRGTVTNFLNHNKNCSFFSYFQNNNQIPVLFDISCIDGQEKYLQYFFSKKYDSVFCLIKKEKESSSNFRERIYTTTKNPLKISKSDLYLLFPSKEINNDF